MELEIQGSRFGTVVDGALLQKEDTPGEVGLLPLSSSSVSLNSLHLLY